MEDQMTAVPEMGFTAKFAAEFADYARPIEQAKPHPDNVRKHKIDRIARSLEKHGQRFPIVVQASTGFIVKGNGTWLAAKMLGWTTILQSWQDMSDDEALTYLYADNKASDESTYDRKKLAVGLQKLAAGPGLFDTLWEIDELSDLLDETEGPEVLDAQPTDAAFADAGSKAEGRKERAQLPGEKMREVPLVLTIADHAVFVANVQALQKRFGTGGSIATIVEAVRRQANAEGAATTGKALTQDQEQAIKREVVKEFRDYILTMGADRSYTGTWVVAQLEHLVPYQPPKAAVPEGQTTIFPPEIEGAIAQVEADTALALGLPDNLKSEFDRTPVLETYPAITDETIEGLAAITSRQNNQQTPFVSPLREDAEIEQPEFDL